MKKQNQNSAKVETTKVENAKVENSTVENVNVSSLIRKHKIDYSNISQKEQKNIREKRRKGLFNIIDKYILSKKGKNSVDEKQLFEEFKQYITNNYNVPLSECENVFNGNSQNIRSEYWKMFIPTFKAYLAK
jgi:hypothetical protein